MKYFCVFYHVELSYINISSFIKAYLPPTQPTEIGEGCDFSLSCPESTVGYFEEVECASQNFKSRIYPTCFCEDHCSFEKCRLDEPPYDCLRGKLVEWIKNPEKHFWIAQNIEGTFVVT